MGELADRYLDRSTATATRSRRGIRGGRLPMTALALTAALALPGCGSSKPSTEKVQTVTSGQRFFVSNTCALLERCGLIVRTQPTQAAPPVGPKLPDGTALSIACQVRGGGVAAHDDGDYGQVVKNANWDKLAPTKPEEPARYIPDLFVADIAPAGAATPLASCDHATSISGGTESPTGP